MNYLFLFILSIIPSILLLWYFYEKDVLEKEPRIVVLYAFLLGTLSIFPAILFEYLLGVATEGQPTQSFEVSLYETFIAVALVEEGMKYLIIRFWALRQREFTELYDGIIYATAVSLGFATLENILYVVQSDIYVALMRAFFTVPMHAFGAVMIGYYLAKSKFKLNNERFLLLKGLILPIMLHGTFNFALMYQDSRFAIFIIPIMGIYLLLVKNIFTKLHTEQQSIALAQQVIPQPIIQEDPRNKHELGEPRQPRRTNNLFWMMFALTIIGIISSIVGVIITQFVR